MGELTVTGYESPAAATSILRPAIFCGALRARGHSLPYSSLPYGIGTEIELVFYIADAKDTAYEGFGAERCSFPIAHVG